jgi:hypothetical protein
MQHPLNTRLGYECLERHSKAIAEISESLKEIASQLAEQTELTAKLTQVLVQVTAPEQTSDEQS